MTTYEMDNFHTSDAEVGIHGSSYLAPFKSPSVIFTLFLAPIIIAIATRLTSKRASEHIPGTNERTVRMLPYWFPVVGHLFPL
jgi:hypothetical protein